MWQKALEIPSVSITISWAIVAYQYTLLRLNILVEEDFASVWDLTEPADRKEISSYVQHGCFRPRLRT